MTLLNSGFACCSLYKDENRAALPALPVEGGVKEQVALTYESEFSYVSTDGSNLSGVKRALKLPEMLEAPVQKGDPVGEVVYLLGEKEIGKSGILAADTVEKAGYGDYLIRTFQSFLL